MPALRKDLLVEQGADFRLKFTWYTEVDGAQGPVYDLTGCTARMQVRSTVHSPALLTASTDNGKILLGGTEGTVEVRLTAQDTQRLNSPGRYDLEITFTDGEVVRLLQGTVHVDLNITREGNW